MRVDGGRVHVELTPTFMGCPALDAMRSQMDEAIRGLGGEPDVEVVLDDSWSTDRITRRGPREAPGGRLRAAGAARRRSRRRCCSSSVARSAARGAARPTTRLENLFGPTPCRSLRYCDDCRQPFEQFKTI